MRILALFRDPVRDPVRGRDVSRLLKNRDFLFLMVGQFVSTIGNNFYLLAIYWYVLELTHSHWDVLATGLAQTLPAVGSLFWGVWIDRWRKLSVMMWSDFMRFVVAGTLACVTLLMAHPPMVILFLLVFALQSLGTVFGPAASSLLPSLVPTAEITSASGLSHAMTGAASLIGVSLGGILMVLIGPGLLFGLDAATFLVSIASLLLIHVRETPQRILPESFLSSWKTGFQILWGSLWMRRLLIVAAMLNLVLVPLEMVLPQWVRGPLRGSAETLGWINATFLVGYVLGALLVEWTKRWSPSRIIGIAFALLGVMTGIFGQVTAGPLPYVIAGSLGIAMGVVESTITGTLMQTIPEQYRGRTFSSFSGVINLIAPVGMAGTEFIIAKLGMPVLFLIIGILVAALSLIFAIPVTVPTKDSLTRIVAR